MIWSILILIVLILMSAFFSGAEIAVFSLSRLQIKTLVKRKIKGANELYKLRKNPKRLLTTILIGNNLVNVAAASLATVVATEMFGSAAVGIITGIMTFIIVLFGELIPKSYATYNASKVSIKITPLLSFLTHLFLPVSVVMEFLTEWASKRKKGRKPVVTEEELKAMIEVGFEEGEVEKKEKEMIERVFRFNDITAEDVMTPRIDVMALDATMKLRRALPIIVKSPFSRIPVYKDKIDNIVGILHIRDVMSYLARGRKNVLLRTIATPAYYVPENKIVSKLFKEFQENNVHMAIVVDEYGGTAGVVTLEDLLEELVGEIADESDINEHLIMRIDKNTIKVHGKTEIKDINDFFNINLPGKDTDTVSWLFLSRLRRIPRKGDKLRIGSVVLEVAEASRKKVVKVLVTKKVRQKQAMNKLNTA